MSLVEIINRLLTFLTVFAQGLVILIIVSNWFPKKQKKLVKSFLDKNVLAFAFTISLAATLGSLFYSEIAGYTPCKLCWFQRIFMYPQPVLFAIALWKKDLAIIKYSLALCLIGGSIALYHYLVQTGIVPSGSCGVVGYSVSCSQRFVMEWGYITIPMMSLTAFGLITTLLLNSTFPGAKPKEKRK